ncbi:unnamed protein product [Prunus armeniaca]|uniref:Uncharacterized protein n=1 Tax=Prunus armeniaca TaxID=36596 RepID=A0A6J5WED9_PRUAR|nr:unnamed protein product [Prunus armeniaca]
MRGDVMMVVVGEVLRMVLGSWRRQEWFATMMVVVVVDVGLQWQTSGNGGNSSCDVSDDDWAGCGNDDSNGARGDHENMVVYVSGGGTI